MEFNFPAKKGAGIDKIISHAGREAIDLIYKLLTYDPEYRINAE